jgi:hypothetical protein
METAIHCFEKAGLGRAPFRCTDLYSLPSPSLAEHNPTAYNNALAALPRGLSLGSCAFCGTAIMHNFVIEDATGKRRFVVGSDCVARTGDAGLIKKVRAVRLAAAQEKRAAKRNMKASERAAAWAAEREARRAEFLVAHADLIKAAEPFMADGGFIHDVMERGLSGGYVSDKALDAVERTIANLSERFRLRALSRHVGTVGARQTFKVTVERIASFTRPSFGGGYGANAYETVWIITMRDEAGNAIVSKSASFHAEKGKALTIKATVKEHSVYQDEQQTLVQRIKVN